MPNRFDKYRMRDGMTLLSERYFNPIWQDLDLRLASIEELRVTWEEVVRTVTDFGLVRMNEVLAPAFDQMNQNLDSAASKLLEIENKRQAAITAITTLQNAIASYQGDAETHIADWKAATLASFDVWKSATWADLHAWEAEMQAWKANLQSDFLQNVSKPASMGMLYDAQGRAQTITETVAGSQRTTTISYNLDGTVASVVITYAGVTRTETYNYTSGRLTGMTATEV
jgi:hypothetical protein